MVFLFVILMADVSNYLVEDLEQLKQFDSII